MKKKGKRCVDCRYYDRRDAKLRWSCVIEFIFDRSICVEDCNFYNRKCWKIWRVK